MAAKAPQAISDMQLTAVRTLTTTLAAPTLTGIVSGSTATLNWTAPVPTGQSVIAGYRLYKGATAGTANTLVGTFTARTTTDTLPGTQFYRVEAFDQFQTGTSSSPISCAPITGQLVKHHPGFYGDANTVISGTSDPIARVGFEMDICCATPGCLGYCVFMTWGAFETAQDVYAIAKLDALYTYLTTHFATPKRMALILEVGAFTNTHPGSNDGSTLPLYLQQNVGLYGQAGYRVAGVTTQPAGASGWWGGDGNGNTFCAQLHRTSVMNRFIKAIQAIGAWGDSKPYFEAIIFGENSLWVGANSANGGGSGYSDSSATTTQTALMQAGAAAFPTTHVVYVNTYMQTVTPAQNLTNIIVNNRNAPGQTDTMGLTRINNAGGLLSSWGVAAYAGQLYAGSTATVTNWRDNGVHLISEVQAPDLGAFGGISGGSTGQVPIIFNAPALTGATSATIANPTSWPNGIGYVVRFSNNTTRSCTVANNHTLTWVGGLSSDCTTNATVLEGGANGWTPQDLVDALNVAYKASHVFLAVIPDSATYVPVDRRWSQASAVFLANPLTNISYPVNY